MSRHENQNESWNRQGKKRGLQKDPSHDGTGNEVPTNQEDFSYLMSERTPVKDCGELPYHASQKHIDYSREVPEEWTAASSKTKRRRILQFDTEARDSSLLCEEASPTFVTSNVSEDPVSEDLLGLEVSHWVPGCSEDTSVSIGNDMIPTSGGWLEQYFNDMEMNFDTDDINIPNLSDINIDISEFCNGYSEYEANVAPEHVKQTSSKVIFKDLSTTSYLRTPTKIASSVAYPFCFIKPSKSHGDVTLMDINQRICSPSPLKSKHYNEEDSACYPKSAITGKPVVKQTKICTEGGKGCITFTRTKG